MELRLGAVGVLQKHLSLHAQARGAGLQTWTIKALHVLSACLADLWLQVHPRAVKAPMQRALQIMPHGCPAYQT